MHCIDALYALISHARTRTSSGKLRPFLNVQVQVWMRELRRLVGEVADKDIKYALSTDLNEQQAKHYLPVINCRECGQTGWASVEDNGSVEIRDIRAFYNDLYDIRRFTVGTIGTIHRILHQLLEFAADDDLIRKNPAKKALKTFTSEAQQEVSTRKSMTVLTITHRPTCCRQMTTKKN